MPITTYDRGFNEQKTFLYVLCQDFKLNLIIEYICVTAVLYCFLFNICHPFPLPAFSLLCANMDVLVLELSH